MLVKGWQRGPGWQCHRRQGGHAGHVLRTRHERVSSPLWKEIPLRDDTHESRWVLGLNTWGRGPQDAGEYRHGHREGEWTHCSEEHGEGKATLLLSPVVADSFFSSSPCLFQELLWLTGNTGRVGLTPSLRSLWLLCMDSIYLSLFMEIDHVGQGRRENILFPPSWEGKQPPGKPSVQYSLTLQ